MARAESGGGGGGAGGGGKKAGPRAPAPAPAFLGAAGTARAAAAGLLAGLAAGLGVSCFRAALDWAERGRLLLYACAKGLPPKPLLLCSILIVFASVMLGLLLGLISKKRPMIRGSGIPQVEGALLGRFSLAPFPDLPLKICATVLGVGAGLSLGRGAPSVLIGACAGGAVLRASARRGEERRDILLSASAAGLSAAFNTPLAGALFVFEAWKAEPSPAFLARILASSLSASVTAGFFFGSDPLFDFPAAGLPLPLRLYPWVILLGALCGVLGDFFKRAIYRAQDLCGSPRVPQALRQVIPLVLAVPLCFFLREVTGGGGPLIAALGKGEALSPGRLLPLLAAKLLFTALCCGSGASGGIFLPLLACGALTGAALGTALPGTEAPVMALLGMAAFFASVVKAPLCGAALVLEMSGKTNLLGGLLLSSLSSFVTAELLKSRPVYTVLLERMLTPGSGARPFGPRRGALPPEPPTGGPEGPPGPPNLGFLGGALPPLKNPDKGGPGGPPAPRQGVRGAAPPAAGRKAPP